MITEKQINKAKTNEKNPLKNYGTISVTQRTATGNDQSSATNLYLYLNYEGYDGDVAILGKTEYCDGQLIGTIKIQHPKILAGSWAENMQGFIRIAKKYLVDQNICTLNDYNTLFLAK